FFSSRRRHTRSKRDWSSDVCSSDLDDLARKNETEQVPTGCVKCVEASDFVWRDRWLRDQVWIERLPLGIMGEPHFTGAGGRRAEIGRASCRERVWSSGGEVGE